MVADADGSVRPVSATPDDFVLVRRARAGDRAAFTQLVQRHQDRVWALARGIVGDPHDAADVAQETFIAVLRHLDQFQEGARFSTWLHSITVRKSYDLLRRRVPEPVAPDDVRAATAEAPDDPYETQLARSALLDAIGDLDEGFRAAVLLVDVLGVSVDDAAVALDIAAGTVKSRVFRGRAQLASSLGTAGYPEASNT